MPSSKQRLEVWKGLREKTSGGLTKADLHKNKRGKIVSKRKSGQASSQNNLGKWLRTKGTSVPKDQMLRKKGDLEKAKPKKDKVAAPKPKKDKKTTKVAAPSKPRKKNKAAKKKRSPAKTAPKKKAGPKINPLTNQPADEKSGLGYVKGGDVSLDNVRKRRLRPRKKVNYNVNKMFDFKY